jgi:hypothetical protein
MLCNVIKTNQRDGELDDRDQLAHPLQVRRGAQYRRGFLGSRTHRLVVLDGDVFVLHCFAMHIMIIFLLYVVIILFYRFLSRSTARNDDQLEFEHCPLSMVFSLLYYVAYAFYFRGFLLIIS